MRLQLYAVAGYIIVMRRAKEMAVDDKAVAAASTYQYCDGVDSGGNGNDDATIE